jgi:uncharacterized protein YkwD
MIDIACPACSAVYKVPETILGKNLKCKGCQTSFVAAAASPPSPSPFAELPASAPSDAPSPAAEKPRSGRGKAIVLVSAVALGVLLVGAILWFFVFGGVSWQEFASKDGGFVVLVPGSPTPGKSNDDKMGVELKEIVAKPSKSGPTYTVQYADLREKPINDYLYLSWMKNNLLKSMPDGKLSEEQEIKLGSHAGKQVTLDLPDDQRLVRRMYLADHRIYLVTAQYPRTTGADVDRFFDSFKITADPPKLAAVKPPDANPPGTQIAKGPTPTMPAVPTAPIILPKATDKAAPPPPVNFAMSDDERTIVDEINKLRAAGKVAPLQPDKELFAGARDDAAAQANNKPVPNRSFTWSKVSQLVVPAPGTITPPLIIENLAKNERNRNNFLDAGFQSIGVGVAKTADGRLFYFLVFAGK